MLRQTLLIPLVFVAAGVWAERTRPGPPVDATRVELSQHATSVDVHVGGRPFTTYYFDPAVAKPYFHPLRSASGTIVTRSYPMTPEVVGEDHDEPHQRAMYFAHGDINGIDFWGEAAYPRWSRHAVSKFGRTVLSTLDLVQSGDARGALRATFDLVSAGGVLGQEVQSCQFSGDADLRIIDCSFSIVAGARPLVMGDTKEGTFAVRVVKALASPSGHMVNADHATGEPAIWGRQSQWVDYYGRVADEDVGVAVLDHPDNLRAPSYWHARAYGLLAANPFGVRTFTRDRHLNGAYTIPAGGTLVLRYRVVVHHGDPIQAGIAERYREFAAER